MIPYERQAKILESVTKNEIVKIDELVKIMPQVSISTLRRDLKELEGSGKVTILAGGAVKLVSTIHELPISTKNNIQEKEKEIIANLAAQQIQTGDVIYLDSGSTCTALLTKIVHKNIAIITTNTNVFTLNQEVRAEIILLGGHYDPHISSINGPLTDQNIQTFNFEKAFIGANGLDVKKGVSTPNLVEANKKRTVLKNSKQCFLLCDSTKFNKISAVKAFDLKEVSLISDRVDKKIAKVTKVISL